MQNYKIIRREEIITPSGELLDDSGLCTLDGYEEFSVLMHKGTSFFEQLQELIEEFEQTHPCCGRATYIVEPIS